MNPRLRDKPKYILSRLMQAGHDQQRFAKRPVLLRYSVAAFAVAVALLIKLLLEPLIVQETPFLLVFVAVLFSAWYGGLGPGLAATAGAALIIDYFFLPPLYSFTAFDIKAVPLGAFVLEGVLFSLIVTALRSVQHRAEANALEAQGHREELRRSEERYRVVAETASDAIFVIDEDSHILFVNDAAENIFGYAGDELLGERLTMLMPERLRGAHQAALKRYVDTGRRHLAWQGLQLPGLHKSGQEIPLEISFGAFVKEGEHFFTGFVRDITERKKNEEALTFMAEASSELASSLDYRETLASVARLAVAHLADWCVVDVLEDAGSLSRLAVAHRDPQKVELTQRLQELYPPNQDAPYGPYQVLRTGEPQIVPEIPQAMLEETARDEEHLKLLRELGLRSYIIVPLVARGRALGVITLVASESGRCYGEADLKLTEDLARRVALAVDNARLYNEAQKELAERQRAEETLRQSEERYRAVVEQAAEGICLIDAEDKSILDTNREFQRMLGYTPEECAELLLYDFVAHDRESVDRNFGLTLQKGSHTAGERRYRRKDGSLIDVMASGSAISYGGRKVASLVIRDITERRRYEEALRISNERFRLLVEGVKDYAIFMLDPDGRIVSWNEGAERISGYRAEEVIGEHFSCLYTEDDLESGHAEEELRLAQAEGRYEEEGVRVRKDGSRFWASATLTALYDEDGTLRGFSNVIRDITERRRAEEALRESEARYRSVIEQAAENIFLADVKTKRILEANAALQSSLGYTAEELRRLTLYDIVDHDGESIDHDAEHALTEGHSFLGERRYRRRDGLLIEVEVNVGVITYGGRQTMSIVAHDVTERKRAEQRLQHTLDRLLALYEASQTLGSTLESEEVVSRLLVIMQRVSHLTAAVISVPEEEGGDMRVWRSVGLDELRPEARCSAEATDARRAALEAEEPQIFRPQSADFGTEPLVGLCLPLLTRDRGLGVLEAYGTEALAESDAVELLGSLASQATSALENARLYGELADREHRLQDLVEKLLVAQEEERRHIAYEVHDGLAQVAVAAHTYLNAFARRYAGDDIPGREKLDRALELIEQTVREARHLIANLRPTALDDFGLAAALRLQVEEFRSDDCETLYEEALGDDGDDGDARLPVAVETALFRVAQEALTNIRKHAESPRVRVRLERPDGSVRLEVRDWGQGFELGKGTTKGGPGERVGLVGMQERIALLGGDLKIHSEPGAGTSIVAEVPLPEEYTEND